MFMQGLYAEKHVQTDSGGPSNRKIKKPNFLEPKQLQETSPLNFPKSEAESKEPKRSKLNASDKLGEPNKLRGILGLCGPRVNVKSILNEALVSVSVAQLLDCSPALRQELGRVVKTNKPAPRTRMHQAYDSGFEMADPASITRTER